jgi:predicted dehydrogenase
MTRPFRLAIIGAGEITRQAHLPAALAAAGVEVAALVDPDAARARALIERNQLTGARAFEGLDGALEGVDGALIASPNHTHRALALRCVAAGVHALIEKPMTTTVEDAEAIVAAAEAARVTVGVGYCTRFLEPVQRMKALLDQDYFGPVRRFAYQFGTRGGWAPVSGYTLDRDATGGGVLVVSGTHFLDRMLFWFGYPDEVEYWDDSQGGPEASARARVVYKKGDRELIGDIFLSKTVALPAGFVMETPQGKVIFQEGGGGRLRFLPAARPELVHEISPQAPVAQENMYVAQIEDFVAACREGRAPLIPAREGLDNVRLTSQMYASRQPLAEGWYDATGA